MIVDTFLAPDAPAGKSVRCTACGEQLARAIEPGGYYTTKCRRCKAIIGIRARDGTESSADGGTQSARVTRVR